MCYSNMITIDECCNMSTAAGYNVHETQPNQPLTSLILAGNDLFTVTRVIINCGQIIGE